MRYSTLALALIGLHAQYVFADETLTKQSNSHVFVLPVIDVEVEKLSDAGYSKYGQEQLSSTPNANRTISDFLRVNPSVQFSQKGMSAGTQGNLKAQDISINGALAYENKLLLDNVSLNNAINPADGDGEFTMNGMGGSSFATTINTDLVCELEVIDSNVSAEYGEFTGGVVKAKTCAPKTKSGELHGQVSYDYTNSAWSRYNYVDDAEKTLFDAQQTEDKQQQFVKQGLSASLYGNLSETLGFSLGASKRWSDIEYKTKLNNTDQSADQQRENQNLNLNIYSKLNDLHDLKIGLQYQNDHADLNQLNVLNSGKKIDEENKAIELELKSNLTNMKLTQSLVYQDQSKDNDSASNESIGWGASPLKNWSPTTTASEGGYGDQSQSLKTLEYKVKSELKAFNFANMSHQINLGAGYGHYEADWRRLADAYSYFKPSGKGIAGIESCKNTEGIVDPYCEESYENGLGQYHVRRHLLGAGEINVSQDRGYIFLEDKMNWQNMIKANVGVRVDYDSLSKQTNVAPRTSLQYLPFADESLKFTTGWNRYFASNVFSYKLQDGIGLLSYNQTRDNTHEEWTSTGYASTTNVQRSQLDIPKTDETMFAVSSRLGMFDAQLKYVYRDNQDQVRKRMLGLNPIVYEYDNFGESKADIYTFTLSNHRPFNFIQTSNRFTLAFDYTDIVRNFENYETTLIPSTYDPYILYDGKIIAEGDRPATNFARPWTARLSVDTSFDRLPIKVSQLLRYRSSYDAVVASSITDIASRPTHDGYIIDTEYNSTRIGSSVNWDIRTTYDYKLANDQTVSFGVTVNNVLNKHNKYTDSGSANLKSEIGRQFIADVSWKF